MEEKIISKDKLDQIEKKDMKFPKLSIFNG